MRVGQWLGVIAVIISLYILWQIRQVLLLVFAAVVFATVLNRVVRVLQRWRVKRGIAIAITLILLGVVLFGLFAIIIPRLSGQLLQLVDTLPAAVDRVRALYDWVQARIPGQILDNSRILENFTQTVRAWVTGLIGNFFFLARNSVSAVLSFLLFLAATIMLLVNPAPYRRVFTLAFPAFYRERVNTILNECETSLVGWIRGTLIAMVTIGTVSYLGLLLLGIPLPLVNALLAGLLEFIPNVGPTLSVIPPMLLAFLVEPWKAIAVIVLYILIQQFESLVLVPFLMEQEVSLLPLFTILSVVVFSIFFGFLGLFLAVPLLIVLQIWVKEVLVHDVLDQWRGKPAQSRQDN
ncbi:AI-2E family transporter [Leptolyngbya sp. AN03gr2]|uniref:AI-2E family transporter n=1 Tax=unclassified Leptolyngbya TaxID=2650499 RepID=UPI003D3191D6